MNFAVFTGANLRSSSFVMGSLDAAHFEQADLYGSIVWVSAQHTSFENTNLEEVNFRCDFRGASFSGANVRNTSFDGCTFDETTVLPDGSHWTPKTDLSIYGAKI